MLTRSKKFSKKASPSKKASTSKKTSLNNNLVGTNAFHLILNKLNAREKLPLRQVSRSSMGVLNNRRNKSMLLLVGDAQQGIMPRRMNFSNLTSEVVREQITKLKKARANQDPRLGNFNGHQRRLVENFFLIQADKPMRDIWEKLSNPTKVRSAMRRGELPPPRHRMQNLPVLNSMMFKENAKYRQRNEGGFKL